MFVGVIPVEHPRKKIENNFFRGEIFIVSSVEKSESVENCIKNRFASDNAAIDDFTLDTYFG